MKTLVVPVEFLQLDHVPKVCFFTGSEKNIRPHRFKRLRLFSLLKLRLEAVSGEVYADKRKILWLQIYYCFLYLVCCPLVVYLNFEIQRDILGNINFVFVQDIFWTTMVFLVLIPGVFILPTSVRAAGNGKVHLYFPERLKLLYEQVKEALIVWARKNNDDRIFEWNEFDMGIDEREEAPHWDEHPNRRLD